MKKEIIEGSYFIQFINRIADYNIFEGSVFFHSFVSLTSRFFSFIKAIKNKELLLFFFLLSTLLTFLFLKLFF